MRAAPARALEEAGAIGWELSACAEPADRARGCERLTLMARDALGLSGDVLSDRRGALWDLLRALAEEALRGVGGWRLRPEPFDRSWHLRRGGDWEPEIQFSGVLEPTGDSAPRPPHEETRLRSALGRAFLGLGVGELR